MSRTQESASGIVAYSRGIFILGSTDRDYLIADEITLKLNREAKHWLDVAQMARPD